MTKLTPKQAQGIIRRYARGGISMKALGRLHSVSDVCIYYIIAGKSWHDLDRSALRGRKRAGLRRKNFRKAMALRRTQ